MIIAVVGRPNVGKSTLFNRLTGSRQAIVDEFSGVTRDRLYGKGEWNGKQFSLIDTGGYVSNSDDIFESEIKKQVDIAIDEADAILFVVDVTSGITLFDEIIAKILRKTNKKIFLVVNKVDNNERIYDSHIFYKLGIDNLYCISSINGSGTGDLLDEVVLADDGKYAEVDSEIPKFAVVGRPNVGKSSLINVLVGEERNIVTPISGTTRDSLYTFYKKFNHKFHLIDTAGLRKKGKVNENLEYYSVLRSVRAIEESDVCLLLIDATNQIESQDMSILSLIKRNNKGVVILVNKWDLVEKDTNTAKEFTKQIKEKIAPFQDIPIVFTSTLTKQRIHKVLDEAIQVSENRRRRISTSKLNELMLGIINTNRPPAIKGKFIKIKYVTQLKTYFPAFAFFCNLPQYIKDPYKRFLENKLREHYNFSGSPIQIYIRKK
ncbi:MAG: ribosome biogenesis GTPase Der [Bacteroidales bacterium]|jgi:GTP-binding protein|nr:ribosome biogenesis GTPase Der [Bacteroidales bacterium]